MSTLRRMAAIASILALAFVAPMSVAYGMWSTAATATLSVSVAAPVAVSPPPAPSTFRCTGFQNNNQVKLAWNAVTPAPTAYRVYRTGSSTFASTSGTTLTVDRGTWGVNNGVATPFVVKAYTTAGGESVASNTVTVTFGSSRSCSPLAAS